MIYGNSTFGTSPKRHPILEKNKNIKIENRITELKNAIISNPYQGIGNPEPLKHELSGKWSRKIDKVNRFVYHIENGQLHIYSLKGHYN